VKPELKRFLIKVGAWAGVALLVHFFATVLLGAPPPFVVPGILVIAAIHLGLIDRTPLPLENGKLLKRGVALLMLAFALWLANTPVAAEKIKWQAYSEELVAAARKGNRPVMIDFTSKACPPCYAMKGKVFSNSRVARAAESFMPLRVDATAPDAKTAELLERYRIEAFPTIVFLDATGKERSNLRLVGFENATFFAERVESAR
jgi:thiol:disulfide interchange protein